MLAIGLMLAGLGTVPFLRSVFIGSLEQSLQQAKTSNLATQLFGFDLHDGSIVVTEPGGPPSAVPYYVALYGPDGAFLGTAGAKSSPGSSPEFPSQVLLEYSYTHEAPFELSTVSGRGDAFRGVVSIVTVNIDGSDVLFTQLLALPTTNANQNIAAYLAIFGVVATLTIFAGALITRWAVTIAFRRLGQVETTATAIAAGDFGQRMSDTDPRTETGRLNGAINVMLDRMDQAIHSRDASVRQMRRFIGDASHELRTPLVSVRGYAELYRIGAIKTPEDTAQAMERIEKEAMRMSGMVEDLLALARLDEQRELKITDVDLRPIARDAALDVGAAEPGRPVGVRDETLSAPADPPELVHPVAQQASGTTPPRRRGAPLGRLRRRPRDPQNPAAGDTGPLVPLSPLTPHWAPVVRGEEDKIRQVVTNLLGNARRFTPKDSPIEIAVGVDVPSHTGWLAVIDHGEGIPEQIRGQIFQRFWRADTSRARETGGSGLGLAIVASIVEAHHGSIQVEETPGGGATFRVFFPLAEPRDAREHLLLETQPLPRFTPET